jgi:hypothetical protein
MPALFGENFALKHTAEPVYTGTLSNERFFFVGKKSDVNLPVLTVNTDCSRPEQRKHGI